MFCCYLCVCVSGSFSKIFEDVIDHVTDNEETAAQYFKAQE